MQQPTIDPYSECMVGGIGQTQPQVSDFLAEEPIVSLKDCRLQNSNGKCVIKGAKQPGRQSDSEQNSDRSFGQTRPQSYQDIGGASVEEEEGPLPTQSNVSQPNHRPQGLEDTKGLPEKYEENQPLLQETHNKASLQDDHNHPSEQLGTHVAAILIAGYDREEIYQEAFYKDTRFLKEIFTSTDPIIIGMSPENVFCIQMVELQNIIKKIKDKEIVRYLVIYYSGHFDKKRGFEIDNKRFMSSRKFEELLKAIKLDIILVTDCCFSKQLQFSEANIKIQIGATGLEERTRVGESGSIFTKILIHFLTGKDQLSLVTDNHPCEVCKTQEPEEVRNGIIPISSLEKHINAHVIELEKLPFKNFTPFISKKNPDDSYIFSSPEHKVHSMSYCDHSL